MLALGQPQLKAGQLSGLRNKGWLVVCTMSWGVPSNWCLSNAYKIQGHCQCGSGATHLWRLPLNQQLTVHWISEYCLLIINMRNTARWQINDPGLWQCVLQPNTATQPHECREHAKDIELLIYANLHKTNRMVVLMKIQPDDYRQVSRNVPQCTAVC